MATAAIRKEISQRGKDLEAEKAKKQILFTRGKWITDNNAMQNTATRRHEMFQRHAPRKLAEADMLKVEQTNNGLELDDGEVPDRVTQADIVAEVDTQTMRKKFDLVLDKLGPYKIDFSINGTHLCLGGLRGHFANMRWKDFGLVGETQLKDKINDIKFLVDHSMIAVAQKRFVYMYTQEGVEMHILSKMANMDRLAYLSRHMLLVGASSTYSTMQYLDISTGVEVGCKPPATMRNPTSALSHNPANDTVATCDLRGVVKMWSPTVLDPLIQLKAHRGAVQDIAFHQNGRFFATIGGDHKLKLWDCRMLRSLEEFSVTYCFDTIDISVNGLVALGGGTNIQIWKDMFSRSKPSAPHMKFNLGYGNIASQVKFCPFEDVLGVGHSRGFTSLIIPGSGEANPDIYYADPHETEAHRKQRVVTTLLDKLPPDTISLDLQIADVNTKHLEDYTKTLMHARRAKGIREKKMKRPETSMGDKAPVGVKIGDDDEVDEELGFKERAPVRDLKSKKELQKERKMKKWDQKDTADKVRSKQTMRHSKIVQKQRIRLRKAARRVGQVEAEESPAPKKARKEGEFEASRNAALRRLL